MNARTLEGARGQYDAEAVEAAIRPLWREMPRSRLLWAEQTCNLGGGSVWPLERLEAVTGVAHAHGLATHLDGARLFNAVVATGVPAQAYAAPFDSAWIDFSKGLGAPVGAALAGSSAFIEEAWRLKQQMGGAMRQSGFLAAAALYALRHNVDRMADDHVLARRLAEAIAGLPGIEIDVDGVETNLVYINLTGRLDAAQAVAAFRARGVRISALGVRTVRAVTHLDVDAAGIERAIEVAREVFA